jgi:hypothetical protein
MRSSSTWTCWRNVAERHRAPLVLASLVAHATAVAEPLPKDELGRTDSPAYDPAQARNYVNLRGGGSSSNGTGYPDVCLELSPLSFVGLEACGTGADIWHDSDGEQLAHFRAELSPLVLPIGDLFLVPQLGLGFAELQIAADEPGFRFGSEQGGVETAGPELSLSLRAQYPVRHGFELIGELNAGAAYFAGADTLVRPRAELQPFALGTLGVGF